jgi:FlgD Ig-like domain
MKKIIAAFFISFISINVHSQLVYKDVAGIFYNRCASCHHQNQHAQSMMNYSETSSWAASIQTDLNSGKMPPWSADPTYTRFLHERIIPLSEKNALLNWISSGALKADTTLAPPPPTYTQYQLNGTPDLVLKIPPFASNANAADTYNCFSLPSGLTTDRVMRAMEIVPGNPGIVHHVVVSVDTTNTITDDLSGSCFTQPGQFGIGGYAPGSPPVVFPGQAPLKMGIRIKANSRIILQIHYPAGTAGQMDSTQIRFYFYPLAATGIRQVYVNTFLQNWLMNIPPNTTASYTAQYPAIGTLTASISVFSTVPHAHKVNRSMLIYGFRVAPKDTIPLVRIPQWNFDLQDAYIHQHLIKIPLGYKLGSKHLYDNTTNNPNNPSNPPKTVKAGTSTTDEMLFDSFEWMYYQQGDELIDVEGLLANDSLLNPMHENEIYSPLISSKASPNPFGEYIKIDYVLNWPARISVSVYNVLGTEIKNISNQFNPAGEYAVFWDGKNSAGEKMPGGVYFYTIRTGRSSTSGKILRIL